MCWKCDHPDSTEQEWLEAVHALVVKHGWAVQFVEDDRTPYAYTVGLHERGLPELVVTALSRDWANAVLNTVARYLVDGGRPTPGHTISAGNGPQLEVVQVVQPDAHLNVAVAFYGSGLQALQLVWSDERGRWPWSAAFCDGEIKQPVLGPRVCPH